jgi:hypothetical protein
MLAAFLALPLSLDTRIYWKRSMTMERVKNCSMAMSGGATSVASVAKTAAPTNLFREVGSKTVNPFRARVVSLFQNHNPEKLSDVDSLLPNYEGWEDALLTKTKIENKCIKSAVCRRKTLQA